MSPYDYNDDAFWHEREKETIVTDVRHNFAFVFQQVVMIHKFYYADSNLSTKAEEVMDAAKKMFEKEQLSEYLYENLLSAYKQYPTMLIGNLKDEEKKIGRERQFDRLKKLKEFLTILIGDLSEELHELIEEQNDAEKRAFIREYFN